MNHVIVTGGAGFVGAHLCRHLLARGDRVTAVDNFSTGRATAVADLLDHPRFVLRTADITAVGVFTGLDTVTHIAHLAHPGSPATGHPALRAACTGTLAVLDLAAAHEARIVLASGPDPRAGSSNDRRATQFDIQRAGHHLIESAAHHHRHTDTGIARLFEVYGPGLSPGDGRASARICAAALRDQTLYVTDNPARSFVYIADAVDALVRMLDTDTPGPIDIAGPALEVSEFARAAIALAGSGWLESTAAVATTGTAVADLTRTRTGLGWQPTTDLPTGLHHTLAWMRTLITKSHPPRPC